MIPISFDAGTIEAKLDVDRSAFQTGLDQAKSDADDFANGTYTAKLSVSVSGATEAKAQVDDLKTDLDEYGAKSPTAHVSVSGASEATAELVGLKAAADGGGGGDGGASGALDKLTTNAEGAGGAIGGLGPPSDTATGGFGTLSTGAGQLLTSISPMTLVIAGLAPALIPLAGLATAAGIGLAGMAASAGAAVGAFGLAALPVFSQVSGAVTTITADQAAFNSALTDTQKSTAFTKLQSDLAGLSPMVQTVTFAVLDAKQAFNDWDAQFDPAILQVFNDALADFKPLLEDITPLVQVGAQAVGDFFKSIGDVANSSAFQKFILFLASEAGPALNTLMTAFENFGAGIATALEKSPTLITEVEKAIVGISKAFLNFTKSKDFNDFLDYIQKNGPAIVSDVEKIGTAIGHFVTVIAPLGLVILNYVADIFQAIGKIGTLVNDLAAFFTNTIPHALSVMSGAFTSGFQDVHNIINTIWHAIENDFVHPLTDFFEITIPHIVSDFVGFFTAIPGEINHVWSDVVNALHTAWSDVANWVNTNLIQPIVGFFTAIPGTINHVWSDVVNDIHTAWSDVANWVNTNMIQPIVGFFTNDIPNALNTLEQGWDAVWGRISSGFAGIWATISSVAIQGVNDVIGVINTIIRGVDVVIALIPGVPNIPTIPTFGGIAGAASAPGNTALGFTAAGVQGHTGGVVSTLPGMDAGPLTGDEKMVRALMGEEILTEDDPRHIKNYGGMFHEGGIVGLFDDAVGLVSKVADSGLDALGGAIAATATPAIDAGEAAVGAVAKPFGGLGQILVGVTDDVGNGLKSFLSNLGGAVSAKKTADAPKGLVIGTQATGEMADMFNQILAGIGAPINSTTLADLSAWQHVEGGWTNGDLYNPFNTTLAAGGSHGTNSVGVQSYPTFAAGLAATVATINQGNMSGIRAALQASDGLGAFEAAVDASPWGTVFHDGGIVPGPPGTDVPAILQSGERVIPANQVNTSTGVTVTVNIGTIDSRDTADYLVSELERHLNALDPVG